MFKSFLNPTGNVTVEKHNTKTGELESFERVSNLVVDTGLSHIADKMSDAGETAMDHILVGSDSATVTASDTDLGTLRWSKSATITQGTAGVTNRFVVAAIFDASEANTSGGYTYKEIAVKNTSAAGGIMLARALISDTDKAVSNTLTITWNFDFAAV